MNHANQLSGREKEVVEQLLQGKSNKLIAAALSISGRTVEFHLKNVYAKLQVSSRVELILKLGNSTGDALAEKLGDSTVDHTGENADSGDKPDPSLDWAPSFRDAVSLIGKESDMNSRRTFYISHGILWAAAIIAASIVGAPPFFSTVLLPALAVAALFVTRPRSRTAD